MAGRRELAEKYTGTKVEKAVPIDEKHTIRPYFPSQRLVESVHLAILLRRPLLLKGEPGCGKTKLAETVAYELYGKSYRQHYFEWHIKSTSKAKDGLYTFDHVKRLRDSQIDAHLLKADAKREDLDLKSDDIEHYIDSGELGKAYKASKEGKPAILLIDEIDKADIDFPNDLLLELDQLWFKVAETGELVKAEEPPIIFITSNDEKELPPAFLRRCLFHFIHFPKSPRMNDILLANFPALLTDLRQKAIDQFYDLRKRMLEDPNTEKKVSTSELIDWVRVLNEYDGKEMLAKLDEEALAYSQTLLKSHTDFTLFSKTEEA